MGDGMLLFSDDHPVALRLDGPKDLQLVYAESLYQHHCLNRLDSQRLALQQPIRLSVLCLEAFRKKEFILEWLDANKRSLSEDPFCLNSFEYFHRSETLLQMDLLSIKTLLISKYGLHL